MPVTPLLETGPRVIRAKLSEAYEGPDETGAVVKLRKGVYVRGETARYFVRIGKATPVETEPPAA